MKNVNQKLRDYLEQATKEEWALPQAAEYVALEKGLIFLDGINTYYSADF